MSRVETDLRGWSRNSCSCPNRVHVCRRWSRQLLVASSRPPSAATEVARRRKFLRSGSSDSRWRDRLRSKTILRVRRRRSYDTRLDRVLHHAAKPHLTLLHSRQYRRGNSSDRDVFPSARFWLAAPGLDE